MPRFRIFAKTNRLLSSSNRSYRPEGEEASWPIPAPVVLVLEDKVLIRLDLEVSLVEAGFSTAASLQRS